MKSEEQKEDRLALRRKRYADNPEKHRESALKRRNSNLKRARESSQAWAKKNPEEKRAASRNWYKANLERERENIRKRKAAHPDYERKRKYGLNQESFDQLRADQGNACAICKEVFAGSPHVDHDHATGFVRGLLCGTCNRSLGGFRDSESLLLAAIGYVRRSELAQAARRIFQVEKTVNNSNKTKIQSCLK